MAPSVLAILFASAAACGKKAPSRAASPSDMALADDGEGMEAHPRLAPMSAAEADAWARAASGDEEDRMRLFDLVGCTGLRERADEPARRMTAIRAMAYCVDFTELPWLVSIATHALDDEALEALQAILENAAQVRLATDPDDAIELHAGCALLLELARDSGQSRARRVLAIRALRMLAERGCVRRDQIPGDFDAKG
jgi:hypothetical protein